MLTFNYSATSSMQVTVNGSTWTLGALSGQRWANMVNARTQLKTALAASPVVWTDISTPASAIIATAGAVASAQNGAGKFTDMATAMLNANTPAWMDFAGKLADYMLDGTGDDTTPAGFASDAAK